MIVPVPLPLPLPGAVDEPGPAVEFVFCVPTEGVSGDGSTIGISSFPPGTEGPDGADGFWEPDEFESFWPDPALSPEGAAAVSRVPLSGFELLKYFLYI